MPRSVTIAHGEMIESDLPILWENFHTFLIDELKRKPQTLGAVNRTFDIVAWFFVSNIFNREGVSAFFKHRREAGNKNSSLNTYVKLFRNIGKAYRFYHPKDDTYDWLLRITYYPVEQEYRDVLTTDEQRKIYEYTSNRRMYRDPGLEARYTAIFMTLGYTAMRISELCALTWNDYTGDSFILRHTKTKVSRIVPVIPKLGRVIDQLPRHNEYVFGSPVGPAIPTRILAELKLRCRELGITKNINNHSFRRTFITDAINNGEDVIRVSRIAGHKSTNTTNGYYYGTLSDLAPLVERLPIAIADATYDSVKVLVRRFASKLQGIRFPLVMIDNENEIGFVVKKKVVFGEE